MDGKEGIHVLAPRHVFNRGKRALRDQAASFGMVRGQINRNCASEGAAVDDDLLGFDLLLVHQVLPCGFGILVHPGFGTEGTAAAAVPAPINNNDPSSHPPHPPPPPQPPPHPPPPTPP